MIAPIVDLQTAEYTNALRAAPLYEKIGQVTVTFVTKKQVVSTIMKDGFVETVNTAHPGDCIITNPDGEQYILTSENFHKRYALKNGVWVPKGTVRAIPNPTGKPLTIIAPWGEEQHGAADCYIATTVDPDNPEITSDRYIIENDAFHHTYRRLA